ncbi:hypothetical protein AERO9A_180099 [Aeromonas salmonicida]|nr:hypothetical protein AERO9A_180099 [Aeromonas salmonicida]
MRGSDPAQLPHRPHRQVPRLSHGPAYLLTVSPCPAGQWAALAVAPSRTELEQGHMAAVMVTLPHTAAERLPACPLSALFPLPQRQPE